MTTREEQERIDEEARRAADETETQALDGLAGRTRDAVSPVAGLAPRRVELDITPEESRGITDSAFGDMSLDDPESAEPDYHAEPAQPVDTDALSAAGAYRDPNDDPSSATSEAADYGAAGMQQMQRAIDGGGARDLARDDMEPLGDVARSGARAGQMFAPSGAAENWDERFRRLGVGGDFAAQVPDADGDLPGSESDGDSDDLTSQMPDASPDTDDTDAIDILSGKPPRDAVRDAAAGTLPRLDDGLPSEAEIADARDNPIEGFFHSLQNGLLGAIGRPRRDFDARGDALEQQRRTGIERRQTAKGADRRADAASERQGTLDERAAQQLAQGERRLDISERQAQTQEQLARSLVDQRGAQTSHLTTADEIARASRADREDATSPISMGAQQAVRSSLAALPAGLRDRIEASFSTPVESMSAAQLEGTVRRLQTIGVRGTGGTGTGGSGAALAQMLVDRHVAATPEEAQQMIDALGARGARTAVQQSLTPAGRRASSSSEGVEILPGVMAPLADQVEARQIRTGFASARTQYASLGTVGEIAQRFGASGPISPEAAGELGAPLSRLRAMVATLQNTGIINPSEAPTIEAMLPDPRSVSQMTFQTLQGRLTAFRGELDSQVESQLATRGVDAAGIRTALSQLHGAIGAPARRAAAPTAGTPAGDTAGAAAAPARGRVRLPDGREVTVRDVDEAVRRGAQAL